MNELNKDQAAILQILQEECAEVIQATSKVFRFGLFDTHPDTPNKTNTSHLEEELGDVMAMIELLDSHKVISYSNIIQFKQRKFYKLRTWSEINVDYKG
jgi:NTP pyrophosphatase (non-canonical NTP hydrolase)